MTQVNSVAENAPLPPPTIEAEALPTTGSASYLGDMVLALPENGDFAQPRANATGRLQIDVDFDKGPGRVDGSADRFETASGQSLSGSLVLANGEIDRGSDVRRDFTFEADLSGTLEGQTFRRTDVTGTITGDFIGTGLDTLAGRVFGSLTNDLGLDLFDGSFSTDRQDD